MEYAQAFLAGRNYASETNSIYTLSGAFSGFRKNGKIKKGQEGNHPPLLPVISLQLLKLRQKAQYCKIEDVNVRTLMYDHTFAFPRLIWSAV